MEYHADSDSYICRNGRELTVTNERRSKTASGYVSVKTYYKSSDCTGCPLQNRMYQREQLQNAYGKTE